MNQYSSPKEYPFEGANEENQYRLFPDDLEKNEHIFFHGTAAQNLQSIIDDGFTITGALPSVSFAKNSSLSLRYACQARTEKSPKGCVIAVHFDCTNKKGIAVECFGLHVYKFDPQPTIIGYSFIPENYKFS